MDQEKYPQKIWKRIPNPWLLSAALILILVVGGIALAGNIIVEMRNAHASQIAPGFQLLDQQGRPATLAQFRKKVVVLTFIDPDCRQLCPLTTHDMVEALNLIGPQAASEVQLLGIDANPEKTQVSDVASYTRIHELEGRWLFLTGSLAELESVWKSYHVFVAVESNDIEHTADVFLIDGNGNERDVIPTPMSYEADSSQAYMIAQRIARLLPDHPAVAAPTAAAAQPDEPSSEAATVNLTALGVKPRPVVVGSAHAHLLLFFAGWLGQGPELEKNLAALDSYADLARQRGWPTPVAVDELTTEPSPAEAQRVLMPFAATLQTPIVEDASGSLADAYHVDDLPWFVLSSASGDILWSHDGWLPATELNQQVSAALAKK